MIQSCCRGRISALSWLVDVTDTKESNNHWLFTLSGKRENNLGKLKLEHNIANHF